jgi:hypothetical protein
LRCNVDDELAVDGHEYADAPHLLALLRARSNRPSSCAAEKGNELAPPHVSP